MRFDDMSSEHAIPAAALVTAQLVGLSVVFQCSMHRCAGRNKWRLLAIQENLAANQNLLFLGCFLSHVIPPSPVPGARREGRGTRTGARQPTRRSGACAVCRSAARAGAGAATGGLPR